uniref:Protein MEF2BNB n=1 Tax=Junco hyemalis TaxID=40217 RepID=A0A8C5IMZ0_JUNHY
AVKRHEGVAAGRPGLGTPWGHRGDRGAKAATSPDPSLGSTAKPGATGASVPTVTNLTDKFTESLYVLANEPSVALFRLQEHVRRSLPELAQHKVGNPGNPNSQFRELRDEPAGAAAPGIPAPKSPRELSGLELSPVPWDPIPGIPSLIPNPFSATWNSHPRSFPCALEFPNPFPGSLPHPKPSPAPLEPLPPLAAAPGSARILPCWDIPGVQGQPQLPWESHPIPGRNSLPRSRSQLRSCLIRAVFVPLTVGHAELGGAEPGSHLHRGVRLQVLLALLEIHGIPGWETRQDPGNGDGSSWGLGFPLSEGNSCNSRLENPGRIQRMNWEELGFGISTLRGKFLEFRAGKPRG